MSADNGVYILQTPKNDGLEWRVRELQAIDSIDMMRCPEHGSDLHYGNDGREFCQDCSDAVGYTNDPNVSIQNAREMFTSCDVYTTREAALLKASEILASLDICEYGINLLTIPVEF